MTVLIVGLGSIARKHITALKQLGKVNFYALRNSRHSKKEDGIINLYSYEEVGEIDFDFFLISNITSKHADAIKNLIPFQKPLFIEKPVFNSVSSEHDEIVSSIKEKGIITYVACSLRFLDSLVEVKKKIGASRVNEVNAYSGSFLPNWRPGTDYKESYSANKEMGGGVHIDLIHELDYLYWIFGTPRDTSSVFTSSSSLEIDAIDYANFLWQYEDFSASVILNYYRIDTKRTLEIVTKEGTYFVDLMSNKVFKNGKEIFSSEQTLVDTFTSQMEFFIYNILSKKRTNFNSIEEAYKILSLCLKT